MIFVKRWTLSLVCLSAFTAFAVFAGELPEKSKEMLVYEGIAKASWAETFQSPNYCLGRELVSVCVENNVSVLCETFPKASSGDADCYTLLEISAFIPPNKSESGIIQWIGKAQPTW